MIVNATLPRRRLGEVGFGSGQCPALDANFQNCLLAGAEMPCSFIRECDPYTGAVHFEYALPYGSSNVNIWDIAGDQAYWLGPNPMPQDQPVFPDYVLQAATFGNSQLTNAPSVPVVTQSQAASLTQQANPAETKATWVPVSVDDLPTTQQPGQVTTITTTPAPATPVTPNPIDTLNNFWKQVTAGSPNTAKTQKATASQAAWYQNIPWWVWAAAAAAAAYGLGRKNQ